MRRIGRPTLAVLLACVGVAFVGGAPVRGAPADITVYRCERGGQVTLQDEPCDRGAAETTRQMQRPQDPPSRPPPPRAADDRPPVDPGPYADDAPLPPLPPLAPPPMFQCTDYDGEVRFTETYAPNTRCVPLSVLGYDVAPGSDAAATCRWVRESCLRLPDASACVQFRAMLKQARSDALHASASHAAYRKSEVERLERIVGESC